MAFLGDVEAILRPLVEFFEEGNAPAETSIELTPEAMPHGSGVRTVLFTEWSATPR